VADVYRALDDETRRLILDVLVRHDGQTLFGLCSILTTQHGLGSTRQAISQHLAILESAGLVTTERRGRTKLHYVNAEPLAVIADRWRLPERREDTQ
jgi:DNA-binding transcriptional ArsR family regulator